MGKARLTAWAFAAGLMAVGSGPVSGQNYPNKSIRVITGEPGGGLDFAARLIAQGITGPLNQTVIVDNRGGTNIVVDIFGKAAPDGYTLLLYAGTLWLTPLLRDKVSYDPLKDFQPVTLTSTAPNIVVVHPAVPVNSVKELIALAKARAGALNYSSGSTGSSSHLSAELFKAMAGVNIVRIPFKGTGPAVSSLIAGEVQVMFASASGVVSQIKSGKLRAIAVTSAKPSALFPGMPTVAASGLPDYESASVSALFAPPKTPAVIVNRLNREAVRFLRTPEAGERFLVSGVETVGSSPAQLLATMKSDISRLGKVIKDAGIREE